MSNFVLSDEQVDDLQLGGLKIIQKVSGFRFTMDSVLLADFADIPEKAVVSDFGSGGGIITLLLIGRGKGSVFNCFEIQKELAEMSLRTMHMNKLDSKVHVYCTDIVRAHEYVTDCSVNSIIMNPPYGLPGTVIQNSDETHKISRNLSEESLLPWFRASYRMLAGKGKLFMIFPAARLLETADMLRSCHLEPKRIRLVYTKPGREAKLVMIEAAKDGKPMLTVMPPLTVCENDGSFTDEARAIYHMNEVKN